MQKLEQKIWHSFFEHETYSAIAQKIFEDYLTITWAAVHSIKKYNISHLSYEFVMLSKNNKYCLLCMSINKASFYASDGLNPDDFKNYVLYSFDTEEELYTICKNLSIDASKFTQTWKCEYPF